MLSIQAEFNAEIIQGHREAFQALREILADAAAIPDFRGSIVSPDCRRQIADTTRRLGLRLRTAVAMLRTRPVKPTAESTADRTGSTRPHPHASTSTARPRPVSDTASQLGRIVATATAHLAAAAQANPTLSPVTAHLSQ